MVQAQRSTRTRTLLGRSKLGRRLLLRRLLRRSYLVPASLILLLVLRCRANSLVNVSRLTSPLYGVEQYYVFEDRPGTISACTQRDLHAQGSSVYCEPTADVIMLLKFKFSPISVLASTPSPAVTPSNPHGPPRSVYTSSAIRSFR